MVYAKKKNKTLKATKNMATKKEDKMQNKVLTSLSRKVNTLIRQPEIKYFVDNSGTVSVSTTGQWYAAFSKDITNGTTDINRIGDQVICKSLHIKGTINMYPLITTAFVRMILVRYKGDYYNYAPNAADLLMTPDFRSFYNKETYKDLFDILHDKTYNLVATQQSQQIYFKIHKNLHNSRAKWDTGLALNAPTVGHYFMYIIGDTPLAPLPYINFTHVFYYTDL